MLKLAQTEEEAARGRPDGRARRARRRPGARARRHRGAARTGHRWSRPRADGRGRIRTMRRRASSAPPQTVIHGASAIVQEARRAARAHRAADLVPAPVLATPTSWAAFHRRGADTASRLFADPRESARAARRPASRQRARLRRARLARHRPQGPLRRGSRSTPATCSATPRMSVRSPPADSNGSSRWSSRCDRRRGRTARRLARRMVRALVDVVHDRRGSETRGTRRRRSASGHSSCGAGSARADEDRSSPVGAASTRRGFSE